MSTRLDFFYSDGSHGHVVYNDVTADLIFETMVKDLKSGHLRLVSTYLDEDRTLTTVVKGRVQEEPWY